MQYANYFYGRDIMSQKQKRQFVFKKEEAAISICDVCGRKTRMPWKCYGGGYCESGYKASNYSFPWDVYNPELSMARNNPNEIFNLR